ncbi:MAG: (2Fe-2S)-binding protein [Legionellales bacterium]|nr:(2Fe-2S)-binding protein [Legionellales bacterium]
MYICLCRNVTEKHIEQAVRNGVCSLREVCKQLGVAQQCGKCGQHARAAFQQACANRTSASPSRISS